MARIAGRAVERPTPVIFAAVLLSLIGAVAALRLEAARSPDSLVDRGSETYAATQDFYDQFGGEPVEVLVKGNLDQLLFNRPFPGMGQYRGPFDNFYMCGSGTHPGGGVMAAPGANASHEILKDFRRGVLQ